MMKICKKCNHPVPQNQDVCPYCGSKDIGSLDSPQSEGDNSVQGSQDMLFCPSCGHQVPSQVNFCPVCGSKIIHPNVSSSAAGQQSTTYPISSPSGKRKQPVFGYVAIIIALIVFGGGGLRSCFLSSPTTTKPATTTTKQTSKPVEVKKVPLPANFKTVSVDVNMIGEPTVTAVLENNSDKTIDAYKVCVSAKNNYGDVVKEYGGGKEYYFGLSQRQIPPHQQSDAGYYWTLHGFENGTKFKVELYSIHYTDGTEWKAEQSDKEEVETTKTDKVLR
jgi:RNA polymerase subunit RPABC4/transcription elongation factor Spt4